MSCCERFWSWPQMVAICSYVRARTSMPRMVALVAQEEVVDDAGQQARSAGWLEGLGCLLGHSPHFAAVLTSVAT